MTNCGDFTYTQDGTLIVSPERIDRFITEWAAEIDWLADH